MKTVLTLASVLALAHYAIATCSNLKQYEDTLVPACDPSDIYVKWPNYEDQYSYYACQGVNNPVLTPCPSGEVFCYVYQACGSCAAYIPPVQCSALKTQNTPKCVPNGSYNNGTTPGPGGSTYPTPYTPSGPTSTPKKTTTPKPTTTPGPATVTPPNNGTSPGVPTPPNGNPTPGPGGNTDIPPPPSPNTPSPNVPMPPTPKPTPPNFSNEPPTVDSP